MYDFRSFLALTAALAAFFDVFPVFASGEVRNRFYPMFVSIEEGFQRRSDQSQKESRCQIKRSMSSGAENRSRCPLSVPLRPRRDAPSLLLSAFSIELEARIWFVAPQRRDLRVMKTRPCAPGKINAPPRSTPQTSCLPHSGFSLRGANLFLRDRI